MTDELTIAVGDYRKAIEDGERSFSISEQAVLEAAQRVEVARIRMFQALDHAPAPSMTAPVADTPTLSVESLDRITRKAVENALAIFHGDVMAAARALGVGKTTLYRWMEGWGLDA